MKEGGDRELALALIQVSACLRPMRPIRTPVRYAVYPWIATVTQGKQPAWKGFAALPVGYATGPTACLGAGMAVWPGFSAHHVSDDVDSR